MFLLGFICGFFFGSFHVFFFCIWNQIKWGRQRQQSEAAVCQEPTQSRLLTGLTPLLPPMTQALSLASFTPPLPLQQAVFNAAQDALCQAQRTMNAEGGEERKKEKKNTGCLQACEK